MSCLLRRFMKDLILKVIFIIFLDCVIEGLILKKYKVLLAFKNILVYLGLSYFILHFIITKFLYELYYFIKLFQILK